MPKPRPKPEAPRPELVRRPRGPFGWLPAALLHEGWLARLGAEATAVLVLLALAADERGVSFYGRGRMTERLGLSRAQLDRALSRLLDQKIVAWRPWQPDSPDGVWQLLPLPRARAERGGMASLGSILKQLGLQP